MTARTRDVAGPAAPFDQEFRAVMAEATSAMDLAVVADFIDRWRRVARSAVEPDGHRAMLDRARRLLAGEDVPTTSWPRTSRR